MRHRPRWAALTMFVGCLASWASLPARADIYTWTDAQGRVNISNLEPPEGARVTKVVRETPRNAAAEAARAAALKAEQQAELASLAQRVEQLQSELSVARQAPSPAQPQVVVIPVVTQAPYAAEPVSAAAEPDCNYSWGGNVWGGYGCNSWGFGFAPFVGYAYPVYAPAPRAPRGPPGHGGRHPAQRPTPNGRTAYTGWTGLGGLADIGSIAGIAGSRGPLRAPSPRPMALARP